MVVRLTLGEMLEDLRAEIGASLAPGHNLNQTQAQKYALRRTQRELYAAYDWPNLITEERVDVAQGTRYVAPFETIDYEQINELFTSYGSDWLSVKYGIDPSLYNSYDPESGEQSYAIQRYQPVPQTGEIEVWPIPNQATKLIARGQMKLCDLKADDDKSTLDGTLIVLFAAADMLTSWSREDATAKSVKAANYLRSLRSNLISQRTRVTPLIPMTGTPLRSGLDYIPEGYPRP